MAGKKVIILGGGLGGLECGYILAKNGFEVTVLEQNALLGGSLQCFKRRENLFDTGFHYVGGLDKGQPLYKIFKYLDLTNLNWEKMDSDQTDEIIIGDRSFSFPTGYDRFANSLIENFPQQKEGIIKYVDLLKSMRSKLEENIHRTNQSDFYTSELFSTSAYQYLKETLRDPLLIDVVSGASLKMELHPEKLPLYTFAQINSTYIQSAWRLQGGGMQIADHLANGIRQMGGEVRTKSKVTHLIENNGKIAAAEINGEEILNADHFISNIYPASTIDLIENSNIIRKSYRRRIGNMPNTFGMFTANIELLPGKMTYQNRNLFIYDGNLSPWDFYNYRPNAKIHGAMVSFQPPKPGSTMAHNIDILVPMHYEEVAQWSDTCIMKRGSEYEDFKKDKADECIKYVSKYLPDLSKSVDRIYTSTPLTYRDYTGTFNGSAYGIQKDCENIILTMMPPKTPVPNLFLTGQNLFLHGILGVSMTAILTCSEFLDKETLLKEMNV